MVNKSKKAEIKNKTLSEIFNLLNQIYRKSINEIMSSSDLQLFSDFSILNIFNNQLNKFFGLKIKDFAVEIMYPLLDNNKEYYFDLKQSNCMFLFESFLNAKNIYKLPNKRIFIDKIDYRKKIFYMSLPLCYINTLFLIGESYMPECKHKKVRWEKRGNISFGGETKIHINKIFSYKNDPYIQIVLPIFLPTINSSSISILKETILWNQKLNNTTMKNHEIKYIETVTHNIKIFLKKQTYLMLNNYKFFNDSIIRDNILKIFLEFYYIKQKNLVNNIPLVKKTNSKVTVHINIATSEKFLLSNTFFDYKIRFDNSYFYVTINYSFDIPENSFNFQNRDIKRYLNKIKDQNFQMDMENSLKKYIETHFISDKIVVSTLFNYIDLKINNKENKKYLHGEFIEDIFIPFNSLKMLSFVLDIKNIYIYSINFLLQSVINNKLYNTIGKHSDLAY